MIFTKNNQTKWNPNIKRIVSPIMYACDLETLTNNTTYFKRTGDTLAYAVYASKIDLKYNKESKYYERVKDFKPYNKGFISIQNYITHFLSNHRFGNLQYHYYHNYSKFDGRFIEQYLLHFGLKNHNLIELVNDPEREKKDKDKEEELFDYFNISNLDGKIKTLKIVKYLHRADGKNEKIVIEFRDSLLLFPDISVGGMGEWLMKYDNQPGKIEHKKFDMNFDEVQEPFKSWDEVSQEVENRVKYDCLILGRWIMLAFSSKVYLTKGNDIQLTIASTAMSHFKSYWKNEFNKVKHRDKGDVFDKLVGLSKDERTFINNIFLEEKWYWGGITTYLDTKTHSGKIYPFDVNSLYPSVMVNNKHPYGSMMKTKKLPQDTNNKIVFKKCNFLWIKQNRRDVPPFIQFNHIYDINKQHKEFENFVYEANDYHFFENIEWWEMMTKHFTFEVEPGSVEYIIFEAKDYFSNYLTRLIDLKQSCSKDDFNRDIYKKLMNSLYGKFGEKPERRQYVNASLVDQYKDDWTIDSIDDEENLARVSYNYPAKTSFLPIATNITSMSRLKLMSTVLNHPGETYNCDTDSMYTNQPLVPELVDESKVGLWSLDEPVYSITVLRAKFYCTGDKDGTILKIASSGLDPAKIQIKKTKDFIGSQIVPALQKKKMKSGYILHNVQKVLVRTKNQFDDDEQLNHF